MKAVVRNTDRKQGTAVYKLNGNGRTVAEITARDDGSFLGRIYWLANKSEPTEAYQFARLGQAIDYIDDYFQSMGWNVYWN